VRTEYETGYTRHTPQEQQKIQIDKRTLKALDYMNLRRNVTAQELKVQYHQMAKQVHPDLN
jgi:DnaJ-class molecular chaperone